LFPSCWATVVGAELRWQLRMSYQRWVIFSLAFDGNFHCRINDIENILSIIFSFDEVCRAALRKTAYFGLHAAMLARRCRRGGFLHRG
jgi:hypothetical protein